MLNLDFETGIKLVNKCIEENQRDDAFILYSALYPYMDEEHFMNFEDFYAEATRHDMNSTKTAKEIIKEIRVLYDAYRWEVSDGDI